MSWILLAAFAAVLAFGLFYFFPKRVSLVMTWFLRSKNALLAIAGIAFTVYALQSGGGVLVIIGFLGVMVIVWEILDGHGNPLASSLQSLLRGFRR